MLIAVSNVIRGHPLSEFQVGVTQQPLRQAFSKVTQGEITGNCIWRVNLSELRNWGMQPQWIERIDYLGSRSVDRHAGGEHQSDIRNVPAGTNQNGASAAL